MGEFITSGLGFSEKDDSYKAGKEAAQEALNSIQDERDKIGLVFASPSKYNEEELTRGIDDVLEFDWIGCTTSGEISNKGPTLNSVVIYVLSTDYLDYGLSLVEDIKEKPREKGVEIAEEGISQSFKEANTEEKFVILLKDTFDFPNAEEEWGNADKILEGIYQRIDGTVPVIGGESGDDKKLSGESAIFFNGEVFTDSAVALFVNTPLKFNVGHSNGAEFDEDSEIIELTDVEDQKVNKINNKPAIEEYARIMGTEPEELFEVSGNERYYEGLAEGSWLKLKFLKLMAKITGQGIPKILDYYKEHPTGYNVGNRFIIRTLCLPKEDGSIICKEKIEEGQKLIVADIDKKSTLRAMEESLKMTYEKDFTNPGAALFFNCFVRNIQLGDRKQDEIDIVKHNLDIPFAGFYTNGEFGYLVQVYTPVTQ